VWNQDRTVSPESRPWCYPMTSSKPRSHSINRAVNVVEREYNRNTAERQKASPEGLI
jgi:hypothetical protein